MCCLVPPVGESVGVNLSVNVVGVVVTMLLSSEDEESDQGWYVNSYSGHDMVGGDGNSVAEGGVFIISRESMVFT